MSCELCSLKKKTYWYFEGDAFIICDCLTCKSPMIVSRQHTMGVDEMMAEGICKAVFEDDFIGFWKNQRKILDHWHWHILLKEGMG